jgi:glyoxylase I family protein
MNIKKVHHIAVIASNYQVSKDFYVNKLGFEIISEFYRQERNSFKLDLKVGDCQIELFSFPNPPKRATNPEAAGLRHLAFEVDNMEETVKKLIQQGISVEPIRIDELTQKSYTFFKDPDGLPLELYQK